MSEFIDYKAAHKHCFKNRSELLAGDSCGCFYCLAIFPPSEIERWVDDDEGIGMTALCPKCDIDSVIGSKSGFRITPEFLKEMNKRWF